MSKVTLETSEGMFLTFDRYNKIAPIGDLFDFGPLNNPVIITLVWGDLTEQASLCISSDTTISQLTDCLNALSHKHYRCRTLQTNSGVLLESHRTLKELKIKTGSRFFGVPFERGEVPK